MYPSHHNRNSQNEIYQFLLLFLDTYQLLLFRIQHVSPNSRERFIEVVAMHEHIATPNYPQVVLAFTHRGIKVEITATSYQNKQVYSAWATYATGSAVAVPVAYSTAEAIVRAKQWIQNHFNWSTP